MRLLTPAAPAAAVLDAGAAYMRLLTPSVPDSPDTNWYDTCFCRSSESIGTAYQRTKCGVDAPWAQYVSIGTSVHSKDTRESLSFVIGDENVLKQEQDGHVGVHAHTRASRVKGIQGPERECLLHLAHAGTVLHTTHAQTQGSIQTTP